MRWNSAPLRLNFKRLRTSGLHSLTRGLEPKDFTYTMGSVMISNKFVLSAAASLIAVALGAKSATAQYDGCQTCYSPVAVTAYQPVVTPAYTSPTVSRGWYPGRLWDTWRLRRAARMTPVATTATCYRPVTRAVQMTSYQPVTSCDPCSGCPTTTYRPVTVMGTQTCYIPQQPCQRTLYRPLSYRSFFGGGCCSGTTTAYAAPRCGVSCGTSTCATGACGTASYVDSGSSCCSTTTSDSTYVPSTTIEQPYSGGTDPRPMLDPNETIPDVRRRPVENGEAPLDPIPNEGSTEPTGFDTPKLINPTDRVTSAPRPTVRTAIYRKPATTTRPAQTVATQHREASANESDGWHSVPRDR